MTQRTIGVSDEAAGAGVVEYRTRERSVSGSTVVEQYLLREDERVASFKGSATTFRTPGVTGSGQNFMTIFNASGSGVLVGVRRLTVQVDYITNSLTTRFFRAITLTTAPTGGVVLGKVAADTTFSSNASVTLRGGSSADGTASAITATGINRMGSAGHTHFAAATDLQQSRISDINLMNDGARNDPFILREGEGLVVQLSDASSTSAHIICNCVWEEFTLP